MKKLIFIYLSVICTMADAEVQVRDIGVIGLMSHDLFAWDHKREINTENGRLDLSTIFDYESGKRWKKGGDPKNAENAPVWSITKRLVKFQKHQLEMNGNNFTQARLETVKEFHRMVKDSYLRLSGMPFVTFGIDKKVNNIEQAALRAFHDVLPGRINIYRRLSPVRSIKLTNFLFAKLYLNEKEMNQIVPYFDGDYAEEFKNIKIPFSNVTLNLMEIDRKFIEKFSPYTQKEMLAELKLVGEGRKPVSEIFFLHHITEMIQKGVCSNENPWIPKDLPCY